MSSIKIEYTNAEGDFFEVNMEAEEVYDGYALIDKGAEALKRLAGLL